MAKKQALGKGLEALFAPPPEEEAVQLPVPRAPKRRKKATRPVPVETPEDAAAARTRRFPAAIWTAFWKPPSASSPAQWNGRWRPDARTPSTATS